MTTRTAITKETFNPMNFKTLFSLAFMLVALQIHGQQIGKSSTGPVLLKNATVHTVTKGILTNTDVLLSGGLISEIGANLKADNAVQVIDCSAKHIYPGFIDAGTRLGLSEVSSISLTNDYNEIGDFIPQMQALTAVNPNATAIPVTRVNGVTSSLVVPTGGTFPGTASLINLIGYTPDQMFAGFKAVVMNFPSSVQRGRFDRRSEEDVQKDMEKATKKINDLWDQLKLYASIDSSAKAQSKTHPNFQVELNALIPVFRGMQKLLVNVNRDADILNAIKWIQDKKLDVVLVGAAEGYRVADKIAKAGIPVITGPVIAIPGREYARYDASYTNAALMFKAGVKVALRTDDAENVRNLPFNAGFAAAYGLGFEEALRSITIVPAEIFGVADKLGSIEKGKVANLFVSTGDPFEMKSRITHLFINGWNVPIESRHTLLNDEFLQRSPGLNK